MSNTARHDRLLKARIAELKPVERVIDYGALDRIAQYAADRRAEMGEARWAELMKEWNK